MDAVEYVKELRRICKSHPACNVCPLNSKFCYIANMCEDAEKAVKIVEQWSKDHLFKTRQSEFLKQFPDAKTNTEGVLVISPCYIDKKMLNDCKEKDVYCDKCRREYWLTEVTDNGNC